VDVRRMWRGEPGRTGDNLRRVLAPQAHLEFRSRSAIQQCAFS
jgi:hypothetical protein